jgi:hypothetical protein
MIELHVDYKMIVNMLPNEWWFEFEVSSEDTTTPSRIGFPTPSSNFLLLVFGPPLFHIKRKSHPQMTYLKTTYKKRIKLDIAIAQLSPSYWRRYITH